MDTYCIINKWYTLTQVSLQIHADWQKKCRSTNKKKGRDQHQCTWKKPKNGLNLLLMMISHWFCTLRLTWYRYGVDSTNELRCVCWLHTLHPVPTGRLLVYLFNPFRLGTGMNWGTWQLRPQNISCMPSDGHVYVNLHVPYWTLWFSNLQTRNRIGIFVVTHWYTDKPAA